MDSHTYLWCGSKAAGRCGYELWAKLSSHRGLMDVGSHKVSYQSTPPIKHRDWYLTLTQNYKLLTETDAEKGGHSRRTLIAIGASPPNWIFGNKQAFCLSRRPDESWSEILGSEVWGSWSSPGLLAGVQGHEIWGLRLASCRTNGTFDLPGFQKDGWDYAYSLPKKHCSVNIFRLHQLQHSTVGHCSMKMMKRAKQTLGDGQMFTNCLHDKQDGLLSFLQHN